MEDILDSIPLKKVTLRCLYCRTNRQVEAGFCSPEHSRLYIERALSQKLRQGGAITSLVMVMEEKDRVVRERKAWREKNPGKTRYSGRVL